MNMDCDMGLFPPFGTPPISGSTFVGPCEVIELVRDGKPEMDAAMRVGVYGSVGGADGAG